MGNFKVKFTIDELANLLNISKEKKEEMYLKYENKTDIDVIKELSLIVYRLLKDTTYYDYALMRIRNINPNICPMIDEMKTILQNMFGNKIETNMPLEENHELIKKELVRFTKLLNEAGIDYYIVGALPCFIKTKTPLFRYHDDIDIMINEFDIERLEEIIKKTDYIFTDDRYPSINRYYEMLDSKKPHTIMAQNPTNEFHIGFFTFRREQDESITITEYNHYIENHKLIVNMSEKSNTPIGTKLRFEEEETEYEDTYFKTSTIESVYKIKQFTKRPKDITDMKKLEKFIDYEKLEQLEKNESFDKKLKLQK